MQSKCQCSVTLNKCPLPPEGGTPNHLKLGVPFGVEPSDEPMQLEGIPPHPGPLPWGEGELGSDFEETDGDWPGAVHFKCTNIRLRLFAIFALAICGTILVRPVTLEELESDAK